MPDERLHACAYHVLRYNPNLVRDEWVNIGILVHNPKSKRARARLIEEPVEFGRVRKLHANADLDLLRALASDFQTQLDERKKEWDEYFQHLNETLSNALQLSPQRGVLTEDLDAELDRLYRDHVALPRYRRAAAETPSTRAAIRTRINQVFRRAGIYRPMQKGVPVEEFTYPGDSLRLDYSYRSNGTRGFVHALTISGDVTQAKVLAFTAESIRGKLAKTTFTAVAEMRPVPGNRQHQFVARLLEDQKIELVPVSELEGFANRLKPTIH